MRRLTARLLLLLALTGTLVPLAAAAGSATPHACCLRKTAHHCHDSATATSDQLALRGTCCHHDCCRAATTSRWASLQASRIAVFAQNLDPGLTDSYLKAPAAESLAPPSTRAPPHSLLA